MLRTTPIPRPKAVLSRAVLLGLALAMGQLASAAPPALKPPGTKPANPAIVVPDDAPQYLPIDAEHPSGLRPISPEPTLNRNELKRHSNHLDLPSMRGPKVKAGTYKNTLPPKRPKRGEVPLSKAPDAPPGALARLADAAAPVLNSVLDTVIAPAEAASPVVRNNVDQLALVLPNPAAGQTCPSQAADPRVTVWLDAAKEEGFHVTVICDAEVIDPALGGAALKNRYAGLILPDQIHVRASDAVSSAIHDYVNAGGTALLVYDFGALTDTGFYPIPKSRFSDLAGVDYVLYESLRDKTIGLGPVTGLNDTWRTFSVPPGKTWLYNSAQQTWGLTGYYYGFLTYPSFVTQGAASTLQPYLNSPNFGLVAGRNTFGQGRVLFVNTPLGWLGQYGTDGLLLHGALRYLAYNMLGLPYLSLLPNGTAGLTLNAHNDCNPAVPAYTRLKNRGFWTRPNVRFSSNYTAGPDCAAFNDRLGMNLPTNTAAQTMVREMAARGTVGSHGGWIHDYYGGNVSETNQNTLTANGTNTFQDLLTLNWNAVANVITPLGQVQQEYSAPEGNNPKWAVAWLESKGVLGYYFVGNTGMAPTRSYREGQLFTKTIVSHPITPLWKAAAIEESSLYGLQVADWSNFYTGLVDFAVNNRTARMVYFHPPGILPQSSEDGKDYVPSFTAAFTKANPYITAGRFRWYTMVDIDKHILQRDKTSWNLDQLQDGSLQFTLTATGTGASLGGQTIVLPKSLYSQPIIVSNCTFKDDAAAGEWLVTGSSGAASAQFTVTKLP
jgi:hypothetical protein